MQLKRNSLRQREEDLEERYRKLQGFAQARIGSSTDFSQERRDHPNDSVVDDET